MEIVGFIASVLMGLLLGLIGSGGALLTVPIFVYLFGGGPVASPPFSLFFGGLTSLIRSFAHYPEGHLYVPTALLFGGPSILAVYAVRKFVLPAIPDPVFTLGSKVVDKSTFILVLFSLLMVAAAFSMIRKSKRHAVDCNGEVAYQYPLILV